MIFSPPTMEEMANHRVCPEAIGDALPFDIGEVEGSLCARFAKVIRACDERAAIKTEHDAFSYSRLACAAAVVAGQIRARVPGPARPVALFFEQGADVIAALWSVLAAGHVYLPLDPTYPPAYLLAILEDADPPLLLTNARNAAAARALARPGQEILEIDPFHAFAVDLDGALRCLETVDAGPDTPAYILYTSGSSGEPKGVVHTHRSVLFDVRGRIRDIAVSPLDRYGLLFAACASVSVRHIFGAHLSGAMLLPFDFREKGFVQLARWLESESITILDINVATFRDLCRVLPDGENFPALRLLSPVSEPVYRRDFDLYRRHFAASCIMQNSLGATETRTVTHYYVNKESEFEGSRVPIGYHVDGKKLLIVDDDHREVEAGEVGEIAIKSRYISPGYWRRPEMTARVFLPCDDGDTIYLTGDLGRVDADGLVYHLGRKDFQIKIRGYRVEVPEVEMALAKLPGVADAAVAAHATPAWDRGSQDGSDAHRQLVAYLVMEPGRTASVGEFRALLAERLPEFAIPSRFEILQALPLTLGGKLDRRALPPPSNERNVSAADIAQPSGSTEIALLAIFEEALGITPIGVDESFFDLGGHSLAAAQLATGVSTLIGAEIPLTELLHAPSVRALAQLLESDDSKVRHPRSPVPVQPRGKRPPLFCVVGSQGGAEQFLRLARHLGDDQPVWALEPKGIDGHAAPHSTVQAMARQHMADLRSLQPHGPYRLCGYSLGGTIVFALAGLLIDAGESVEFIGIIDSSYPRGNTPKEAIKHALFRVTAPFLSRSARLYAWKGAGECAGRAYRPPFLPLRVTYFSATGNPSAAAQQAKLARWQSRVAEMDIIEVPGSHLTAVQEPNIQTLAAAMTTALNA